MASMQAILKLSVSAISLFCMVGAEHTVSSPQVIVGFLNGQLNLSCQHNTSQNIEEFNVSLLKMNASHKLCELTWQRGKVETKRLDTLVDCQPQYVNNCTVFTLSKLQVKDTASYSCLVEINFPPPYLNFIINKTYVYIHDSELQNCDLSLQMLWILLFAVAMICVILAIITIILYLQIRLKKQDPTPYEQNSEYMPMAAVTKARHPVF
ncbi:uncharacterized protein LOC115474573 [Microcaecilia unicolor]|uniref:Inducible T-cell costimulator n=1 Tax=Microcaecilia unicolor TaxID=1415580 RepID=A0A6P7YRZ4_9AMPH|nr:uncharacterized protein LOC115474573 [Microcaecilia unicolor]